MSLKRNNGKRNNRTTQPRFADEGERHHNQGLALADLGRFEAAVAHYERALALEPADARIHNSLGVALTARGRFDEAISHYKRAVALDPSLVDAHNNLGVRLAALGKLDDAIAHYERALGLRPRMGDIHNNLGVALVELGRIKEAIPHYDSAIRLDPSNAEAHYNRSEVRTFRRGDPELEALESLAAGDEVVPDKMPLVHFALAKALEDAGDYGRAFEHLRKGNDLKRGRIHYDDGAVARLFERIAAVFDRSVFDRLEDAGDPSAAPVFVLGMPRSGSTLVEQILASHPGIHGAGEIADLGNSVHEVLKGCGVRLPYPECVPSLDPAALRRIGQTYLARVSALAKHKVRIVNKLPDNFMAIGLIRLILPNARIIHTVRNPADTCLSCYSKRFTSGQPFSYDLSDLGRYYRHYSGLMAHWRSVLPADAMLDVAYEDVVGDLEGQARRLIDYCGLEWDERCVSFHRTCRPVKTASAAQVRRPLFRSSVERWRRYESRLGPLLRELSAAVGVAG